MKIGTNYSKWAILESKQGSTYYQVSDTWIKTWSCNIEWKMWSLFISAKSSLSLWSKWPIGCWKWFLNTNLFLNKPFLIAKFYCTYLGWWVKHSLHARYYQYVIIKPKKHNQKEAWITTPKHFIRSWYSRAKLR